MLCPLYHCPLGGIIDTREVSGSGEKGKYLDSHCSNLAKPSLGTVAGNDPFLRRCRKPQAGDLHRMPVISSFTFSPYSHLFLQLSIWNKPVVLYNCLSLVPTGPGKRRGWQSVGRIISSSPKTHIFCYHIGHLNLGHPRQLERTQASWVRLSLEELSRKAQGQDWMGEK